MPINSGNGLEFRNVNTLSKIYERHPNWNHMSKILTNGSEWPLDPLDKESRRADVEEALFFGNHKGASLQPDLLWKLISMDVHYGYCLPFPLAKATKIPDILIAPFNIQKQNTINEHGQIVEKDRQTHNQSFKWSPGTSNNNRTQANKLLPCMFGACIRQIVNWAVTARGNFPNVRILTSKFDFKSAFQ
jgi:hypothetical protein